MQTLGFDFEHGRLDEPAPVLRRRARRHPHDRALRRDRRRDRSDGSSARDQPCALQRQLCPRRGGTSRSGRPRSVALHESQSLLVEMQVCRSRPFLTYLAPVLAGSFGVGGPAFAADNLYRQARSGSSTSLIQVADEVTYPCTSCCATGSRRRWSRAISRSRTCRPPGTRACARPSASPRRTTAWACSRTSTGPGRDRLLSLLLGAILAAQLYEAMIAAEPDLPTHRRGRLPTAARRLRSIHEQGARYETQELIARHRPPARAATVPPPPRDPLSGLNPAPENILVAEGITFILNSTTIGSGSRGSKLASKSLRCYAEGRDGSWEAICLDLDIAVQGGSFEGVQLAAGSDLAVPRDGH